MKCNNMKETSEFNYYCTRPRGHKGKHYTATITGVDRKTILLNTFSHVTETEISWMTKI